MLVKDALDKGLLRIVPLNENGSWFQPYKGKPVEKYQDHMDEVMYVIRTSKDITLIKDSAGMASQTYVSPTGVAIVYSKGKKLPGKHGMQFKIKISDEFLNAEIGSVDSDEVAESMAAFNSIAVRVLKGETLSEVELASFVETPDTYQVFSGETLLNVTGVRGSDLAEIVRACQNDKLKPEGERARLLMWERAHDIKKPLSYALFSKGSIVLKGTPLLWLVWKNLTVLRGWPG